MHFTLRLVEVEELVLEIHRTVAVEVVERVVCRRTLPEYPSVLVSSIAAYLLGLH